MYSAFLQRGKCMPFFLRLCFAASEMIGHLNEDERITYFGMFCSKYTSNLTYIVAAKEAMRFHPDTVNTGTSPWKNVIKPEINFCIFNFHRKRLNFLLFFFLQITPQLHNLRWLFAAKLDLGVVCLASEGVSWTLILALAPFDTVIKFWYFGSVKCKGLDGDSLQEPFCARTFPW